MRRSSQSITLASDSRLRDRGLFRILAGNIALSMKPIKQNDNIQYTKQILKYYKVSFCMIDIFNNKQINYLARHDFY